MDNNSLTASQNFDNHPLDWNYFFKQVCHYHAQHETVNHRALRDIAYIAYVVGEQGGFEQALCRTLYSQIAAHGFRATTDNLTQLSNALASLTQITIENLTRIHYGTWDNPYYQRVAFYYALEHAMDTPVTSPVIPLIKTLCGIRPWDIVSQSSNVNSATEQATQILADQFKLAHEDCAFHFESERYPLFENWYHLVEQGHALCQPSPAALSDYEIYQQQFIDYIARYYKDQRAAISTLSYGLARMVQMAIETQQGREHTALYAAFLATIEKVLGQDALESLHYHSKQAA